MARAINHWEKREKVHATLEVLTQFLMKAKFSEKDLTNTNKNLKRRSRKPNLYSLKRKIGRAHV